MHTYNIQTNACTKIVNKCTYFYTELMNHTMVKSTHEYYIIIFYDMYIDPPISINTCDI